MKKCAQLGLGHTLSLILMLANQQSRRVLYVTNRSNTPETAFKRYTVTALHITVWYKTDVLSPEWMKSLRNLRRIHDGVGKYFSELQATKGTDFYKPLVTEESGKEQEFKPNKQVLMRRTMSLPCFTTNKNSFVSKVSRKCRNCLSITPTCPTNIRLAS